MTNQDDEVALPDLAEADALPAQPVAENRRNWMSPAPPRTSKPFSTCR